MGIFDFIKEKLFGSTAEHAEQSEQAQTSGRQARWGVPAPPSLDGFTTAETYIAGSKRNEYQSAVVSLRERDVLRLEPEPSNPADPHAVAVYSPRGEKVGYVPKDYTGTVHGALAKGGEVQAVVKEVWVRGREGRGNLAVEIWLGWKTASVRERSAARAAGTLAVDLGSGEPLGVRGISREDAWYKLAAAFGAASGSGRHLDAYAYCVQGLKYVPDAVKRTLEYSPDGAAIRTLFAIEDGLMYAAVLDDEPRIRAVQDTIDGIPQLAAWNSKVERAEAVREAALAIRKLLAEESGVIQSSLGKRLNVDGKDTARAVKYLEALGLVSRSPAGSSYALALTNRIIELPAWFDASR